MHDLASNAIIHLLLGGVVGEGRDELFAGKLVPSSVVHLHPEDAVAEGMLRGWAAQGRSRGLASGSVATRERLIQRFIEFSGEYPWRWSPEDVEAWSAHLRDGGLTLSTLRGYQAAVRQFCDYVTDSRYGWGAMCWERFGTHRCRCVTSGTRWCTSRRSRPDRRCGR